MYFDWYTLVKGFAEWFQGITQAAIGAIIAYWVIQNLLRHNQKGRDIRDEPRLNTPLSYTVDALLVVDHQPQHITIDPSATATALVDSAIPDAKQPKVESYSPWDIRPSPLYGSFISGPVFVPEDRSAPLLGALVTEHDLPGASFPPGHLKCRTYFAAVR